MPRRLFALVAAIAAAAIGLSAAVPDGQEDICGTAAVIFCDNFEARAVGSGDIARSTFKNRGWPTNDTANITIINDPANVFRGNRSLQFRYPEGGGGIGFMDPAFGASYRTIYMRWYAKWSTSYTFSPIATKHVSFVPDSGGQNHYIFWAQWGLNKLKHYAQYADTVFEANLNGDVLITRNQWYCLEFRVTQNSGATSTDGSLQGWVDGVQHWEYPNRNLDPRMPNLIKSFLLSGYWNCLGPNFLCDQPADQHPLMYRWHDNFVVSTQRIGCVGPAPPTALSIR